jgi:D-alanyl-D-alanine dipeptidase
MDGRDTDPRSGAGYLAELQAELEPFGLGLLVFDAYRPQRAVDHFVRWARDLDDTRCKQAFYPDVPKSELFEQGYIASRSGHSRGSTVDLTIVPLARPGHDQGPALDMGGAFDLFSPLSWPTDASRTPQQRANRLLLRTLMIKHGFAPYSKEWWHFTLVDEPFPDTYFDFPLIAAEAAGGQPALPGAGDSR